MLARRLPINTKTKQKLDSLFKHNYLRIKRLHTASNQLRIRFEQLVPLISFLPIMSYPVCESFFVPL